MEGRRRYWWVYVLLFLLSQSIGALLPMTFGLLSVGSMDVNQMLLYGIALTNTLAILFFFLYRPDSFTWSSARSGLFGFHGWQTLFMIFLSIPFIVIVNLLQEILLPDIPDFAKASFEKLIYNPLGILFICLLGPLSEELLFRGGVQADLSTYFRRNSYLPVFISALIFSLAHMNPAQLPAAFVLGLFLGYAYWLTGSILTPLFIHVVNNSLAVVLFLLSPTDESLVSFFGGPTDAAYVLLISVMAVMAMLTSAFSLHLLKSKS